MAAEDTGQLGVIYEQIMAGDPKSFTTAGGEFKDALKALDEVEGEIPTEVGKLVGVDWKGPAADAFKDAADKVVELIGDTASAVGNPSWKTALDTAKTALETAQNDIQDLANQWNNNRADGYKNDVGAFGAAAETILQTLTEAYDTQREAMKPVKDIDDANDDDANDDDANDDDDDDPKGDEPKDGAPEGGEPKDGAPESVKPEDPAGGSAVPDGDSDPKPPAVGELNAPEVPGGPGEPGFPGGNLIDEPAPGAPDVPPSGDSPFFDPKAPDTHNLEGGNNPQGQPPVLGKPGEQDPSTTLSSASNPGGGSSGGGPPSQLTSAGLSSGGGPPSQLTSAGLSSGGGPPSQLTSAGPSAGLVGSTGHGLFLAGAGARGPVGPGVAPIVAGERDDDEGEERETELLGDEEWDDAAHVPAAIGRPE
jgi:uncharacterized protein YukE